MWNDCLAFFLNRLNSVNVGKVWSSKNIFKLLELFFSTKNYKWAFFFCNAYFFTIPHELTEEAHWQDGVLLYLIGILVVF